MKGSTQFFGTDGIRGHVGEAPITVDFMLKLGWAVGSVLSNQPEAKVLIGKDTRISGYMIESALEAGLAAAGVNTYLLGPLPTSAIAYLTRTFKANIGIVISASHNPYDDNGVKFFSGEGFKISQSLERDIENQMDQPIKTKNSMKLGKAWRIDDAAGRYIEFCKSSVPHYTNLKGLRMVVDCANGATYHIATHVMGELGAHVIPIHATPDGFNINEACGSMHPEVVRAKVLQEEADLGMAFDGDGDRVVFVDHHGEILDGDELLYIIAEELLSSNLLKGGMVGTTMSNYGLELAVQKLGLGFCRVPVGDHFVIEKMIENNWQLGGEPSGHIIYSPVTTSSDGIITALKILQAMHKSGLSLHELKQRIKKFPQSVNNVPHHGCKTVLESPEVKKTIQFAEKKLHHRGRVVVRYSGTEHVIRVMVEGEDQQLVDELLQDISSVIRACVKVESPHSV